MTSILENVRTIQILSDSIRFGLKFLFESELFENFESKYNIILYNVKVYVNKLIYNNKFIYIQ